MKEETFYKMLEVVETFNNVTEGYYPTVKELEAHRISENMDKHLAFVAYFASDPLKRAGNPASEYKDYKDTVLYCKKLLSEVELMTS